LYGITIKRIFTAKIKEANRMRRMRLDYMILDLVHDYRQHKALMRIINRRGNLATWIINLLVR
jgi:hypothetical protein